MKKTDRPGNIDYTDYKKEIDSLRKANTSKYDDTHMEVIEYARNSNNPLTWNAIADYMEKKFGIKKERRTWIDAYNKYKKEKTK